MPSCRPAMITPVVNLVMQIKPLSVLDVGFGFGKWGFLFREYLDIWALRFYKNEWTVRIDGIEAHEPYVGKLQREIYNNIYIGEAEKIIGGLGVYDLVFMGDCIEHMKKDVGREFLKECWENHVRDALMLTTPTDFRPQEAVRGNKYEMHKCAWTADELTETFGTGHHWIIANQFIVFLTRKQGGGK